MRTSRKARSQKGKKRPPLSLNKRRDKMTENAGLGAIAGALAADLLLPGSSVIGAAILGALGGLVKDPDE
jgi:hypothetical protein